MGHPTFIVAAEIYSPNLGDGVIFETTRYLIKLINPQASILPYDISLRTGWNKNPPAEPRAKPHWYRWIMRSNAALSCAMLTYYPLLKQKGYSIHSRSLFTEADGILIGGGQLLRDQHLNFPLKLHILGLIARKTHIPLYIFACGVGLKWSYLGAKLLNQLLTQAETVSVRDELSQQYLAKLVPHISCQLASDPALWSSETYVDFPHATKRGKDTIGLCVIAPEHTDYHCRQKVSLIQWECFWLDTIAKLNHSSFVCELFCNGTTSDYCFAKTLHHKAIQRGLTCSLTPRPFKPQDLVSKIQSYHALLGARLHANIIATSYHIPSIGLLLDEKIKGFYSSLGYPNRFIHLDQLNALHAFNLLQNAINEGVDPNKVAQLKQKVLTNIKTIIISEKSDSTARDTVSH